MANSTFQSECNALWEKVSLKEISLWEYEKGIDALIRKYAKRTAVKRKLVVIHPRN